MHAKAILITGASDGLGRGVARELSREGHTVLLHGRDPERLEAVALTLPTPGRCYCADLASLDAVRGLIRQLLEHEPRIDVLIANAGIGGGPRRESAEGYELQFAVNYLAHFLLVNGLLERLRASAPARIVLVSSIGQAPVDFDDVMLERHYDGMDSYRRSKLAQVSFGFALAERLDPAEITVTSLHPGSRMPTKMVHMAANIDSLERGITNVTRLAVDPHLARTTGVFFDREQQSPPHPWAGDRRAQEQLWRLTEELIGETTPTE